MPRSGLPMAVASKQGNEVGTRRRGAAIGAVATARKKLSSSARPAAHPRARTLLKRGAARSRARSEQKETRERTRKENIGGAGHGVTIKTKE